MLSLKYFILAVTEAYTMVIFVYVLMSWLPVDKGLLADIYRILGKICDPYLNIFKKILPPLGGMVDITPIIALLVLQLGVPLLLGLF